MALISGKNDEILKKYSYPSLYIDFAKSKLSRDRITKDGDILVFSRETAGTYIGSDGLMTTADIDEPRYEHDSITKESLGLLIEEERTNIIKYSEDFSFTGSTEVSGWTSPEDLYFDTFEGILTGTLVADAAIAPDGLQTADLLISDNPDVPGFDPKAWAQQVGITSGTPSEFVYSIFSIFIKNVDSQRTKLFMSKESSNFSIELVWSGSIFQEFGNDYTDYPDEMKWGYQELSSSWYRFWIGFRGIEPDPLIVIYPEITQGVTGSSYFWGAQLEECPRDSLENSVPTSYIKTTDTNVTRKRDKAKIIDRPLPESGFKFRRMYNQDVGTLFIDANWNYDAQYSSTRRNAITLLDENNENCFIAITNFGSDNGIGIARNPGTAGGVQIISGSSINILERETNYTGSNFMRSAIVIEQNNSSHIYSGSSVVDNELALDKPVPTQLWVGSKNGDDNDPYILNGHVKRFVYWPRRLADEGLKEITEKDW